MGILVIATVKDKVFALLLLENSWAKWKEQAYINYKEVMKADRNVINKDMELEKETKKHEEDILAKA
jgi:hypothetical protein